MSAQQKARFHYAMQRMIEQHPPIPRPGNSITDYSVHIRSGYCTLMVVRYLYTILVSHHLFGKISLLLRGWLIRSALGKGTRTAPRDRGVRGTLGRVNAELARTFFGARLLKVQDQSCNSSGSVKEADSTVDKDKNMTYLVRPKYSHSPFGLSTNPIRQHTPKSNSCSFFQLSFFYAKPYSNGILTKTPHLCLL